MGKEYNRNKKIEEYEEVCPHCNGKGYILESEDDITSCIECRGSGKLDWLERLFGKHSNSFTVWFNCKPVKSIEMINVVLEIKKMEKKGETRT